MLYKSLKAIPPQFGISSGRESFIQRGAALGRLLVVSFLLIHAQGTLAQEAHTIPLFMSASNAGQQGFARIINRSAQAGSVRIHAIDDTGERFGPISLALDAKATVHFNSGDLERGNPSKGVSGGVGSGAGNWRLELETDLDIEALAFIRTPDGFLTSMHDVVDAVSMRHHVLIFNPGSNTGRRSLLRLINTSGVDTEVVIDGLDDRGEAPPGGEVRLTLPADAARTLSAQALEEGGEGFDGRFGDGAGKWQLFVSAGRPIQAMSLLASRSGHLSNLSSSGRRSGGSNVIRGGPGDDELFGTSGDDIFFPDANDEGLEAANIVYGSTGDDSIIYTVNGSYEEIRYSELDTQGITATIDGPANRATVDKGADDTDTIVGVATKVTIDTDFGGFGLYGTRFDDIFNLTLEGGEHFQWMQAGGGAGDDTFNIESRSSSSVRIDYKDAPSGIDVDLGAGRTHNDGFGDIDTFNGRVWEVHGSVFSDNLTGSGNNESFIGGPGDDVIDGRGGFDRLNFDRANAGDVIRDLDVDLEAGTATGTWNGSAFSYRLSNIEWVRGGDGDDTIRGGDRDNRLEGGPGDDVIYPGVNEVREGSARPGGGDYVIGSVGSDWIVYTDSSVGTHQVLDYSGLSTGGITATIDGVANQGTVDKGAAGTDTLVDVADAMALRRFVRGIDYFDGSGDFELRGTRFDDVFIMRTMPWPWQYMHVRGGAGNDTFTNQSAGDVDLVEIYYDDAPNGIHLDLAAGKAWNDGYGDVDTINGLYLQVSGSDYTDVITLSSHDESVIGTAGDDILDGGGGFDRLRFHRNHAGDVNVDLEAGTATGTHDGAAFSYTVSNFEWVMGGSGDDRIRGDRGDNRLQGRGGRDIFVFGPEFGNDTIYDFTDGVDRIDINELNIDGGISDVASAITGTEDILIDLSRFGEGTIRLRNFDIDDFDESDYLI